MRSTSSYPPDEADDSSDMSNTNEKSLSGTSCSDTRLYQVSLQQKSSSRLWGCRMFEKSINFKAVRSRLYLWRTPRIQGCTDTSTSYSPVVASYVCLTNCYSSAKSSSNVISCIHCQQSCHSTRWHSSKSRKFLFVQDRSVSIGGLLSEIRECGRRCAWYMDSLIETWKEIVSQRRKRLLMKSTMALVDNGTEENPRLTQKQSRYHFLVSETGGLLSI